MPDDAAWLSEEFICITDTLISEAERQVNKNKEIAIIAINEIDLRFAYYYSTTTTTTILILATPVLNERATSLCA